MYRLIFNLWIVFAPFALMNLGPFIFSAENFSLGLLKYCTFSVRKIVVKGS